MSDEIPCTSCGGRLIFSARLRGDGLCGPCSRKTASPLCANCREKDGHHDAGDDENGHGCMFCKACCEELTESQTIDHDALVSTLGRVAVLKARNFDESSLSMIGRKALLGDLDGLLEERHELRKKLAKVRGALVRDGVERCPGVPLYGTCNSRWPSDPASWCVGCAVREALA